MKPENPIRTESLAIPLSTEDGSLKGLVVESDSPQDFAIYILSEDKDKREFVGSIAAQDFLALCRRSVELWDGEEESDE